MTVSPENVEFYKLTQTRNKRREFLSTQPHCQFVKMLAMPPTEHSEEWLSGYARRFRRPPDWGCTLLPTKGKKLLALRWNLGICMILPVPNNCCADVEALSSGTKEIALSRSQSGHLPRDYDSSHDVSKIWLLTLTKKVAQEKIDHRNFHRKI
jgi:hypothetical protein